MGWSKQTLRAPATLGIGAVEQKDIVGTRGATCVIIVAKATDGNTLAAFTLERQDIGGSGASPTTTEDAYQTDEEFSTPVGDAISGSNLNVRTSGAAGSAGRARRFFWPGAGGCPWNKLRINYTGGGVATAGLAFYALIYHPSQPEQSGAGAGFLIDG